MAKKSDEFAEVKKLLDSIQQDVAGGEYVYRGTPKRHRWNKKVAIEADEKRINSSIFRKYGKNPNPNNSEGGDICPSCPLRENASPDNSEGIEFDDEYRPINIELEFIEKARPHFLPHTSNLEILSDLRHFDGDTTLIDFSRDVLVALFFACSDEFGTEGELVAFPTAEATQKIDDYFKDNDTGKEPLPKEMSLLPPALTQANKARVIAQKSVFVHAPEGFISLDLCKIIPIKKKLKEPILDYLKHFHDIEETTIYPDLHGFIAEQKRFATSVKHLYTGAASAKQGDYEKAIEQYDEAIRLYPKLVEAYCNRGGAKAEFYELAEFNKLKEAIADCDKAIRMDPHLAGAYYNRGIAKLKLNIPEEAIEDFDEAIRLKPYYADAYHYRGVAKVADNRLEEAIEDFDEAIRLSPDYAGTYRNRGQAWEKLGENEKAQSDFAKAKKLESKQQNKRKPPKKK